MAKGGTKISAKQIANLNGKKSNIVNNSSYKMSDESDIDEFSNAVKDLTSNIDKFSEAVDKISSGNDSRTQSDNNRTTNGLLASIRDGINDMSDSSGLASAISSSFSGNGGLMSSISEGFEGLVSKITPGINAALSVMNTISSTLNSINSIFEGGIQQAISAQSTYLSQINTRLYGNGEDTENYYNEIVSRMTEAFGDNSLVSQEKLLKNIADAVSRGVDFNYEERAYLETIAEKTVSTFDAFDKSLTQLIKIQQVDTTITAMGGEGLLTKFLNSTFEDTSYLTDLFDSINSVILDAMTQFDDYALAQDFQFAVQSWLGSLYSVGVDSNTITKIAQGLNYLSTGNVTALGSDTSLQNLLVMSATNAGLSYSDLLTNGLDADTVNELMASMVDYLQDIAYNTDSNEVVKSAWTSITGVSVSDLRAIQNLQQSDIDAIKTQVSGLSYEGNLAEANHQIELMTYTDEEGNDGGLRVGTAERVETGVNNFLYAIGQNLVTNSDLYARYYKAELVQSMVDSLSGSFGLLGDVVDGVVSLVNAIQETSAISEAINTTMQGLQRDVVDIDTTILGEAESIDENTESLEENTESTEENTSSSLTKTDLENVYSINYRYGTDGSASTAYIKTYEGEELANLISNEDNLAKATIADINNPSEVMSYTAVRNLVNAYGDEYYDAYNKDSDNDNTIMLFTNGGVSDTTQGWTITPGTLVDENQYSSDIIVGYQFVDENGNPLDASEVSKFNTTMASNGENDTVESISNLVQSSVIDYYKNNEFDIDSDNLAEELGKNIEEMSENGEFENQIGTYGIIDALTKILGIAFGDTVGLTTLNPYATTKNATARGEAFYGLSTTLEEGEIASGLSYSSENLDSASNTLAKTADALESTYTEITGVEETEAEKTTTDIYNTTDGIYTEVQSFNSSQDVIAVNTSSSLEYQQSTNDYLQKLYTAIFENQQAINVNLSSIADDVYSKLIEYLGVNTIKSIESILLNDSVNVKMESTNSDYFSTISSIRGAY